MLVPGLELPPRATPLILVWPAPGNPVAIWTFEHAEDWREFVSALSLHPAIPDVTRLKFERAQKLFLLGWLDGDLLKGAELIALTALETALRDRYGRAVPPNPRKKFAPGSPEALMAQPPRHSFKALLRHLVEGDGLTDDQIPMIARCGGTAIGQLVGETNPGLDERRNAMAHGDPFDGLPTGGLIELVRDLIMYAYRDFIREITSSPPNQPDCRGDVPQAER